MRFGFFTTNGTKHVARVWSTNGHFRDFMANKGTLTVIGVV